MSRTLVRVLGVLLALSLAAAACADDGDEGGGDDGGDGGDAAGRGDRLRGHRPLGRRAVRRVARSARRRPHHDLRVAGDLAGRPGHGAGGGGRAPSTSAAAPTARASRCTTATTRTTLDKAVACVDEMDRGRRHGHDQRPGPGQAQAEVVGGVRRPRASHGWPATCTNNDWGDQNAYPLDASGTGIDVPDAPGAHRRGRHGDRDRSGSSGGAAAMQGLLEPVPSRTTARPSSTTREVPAGTTDFTQFIQGAEAAGATGVMLALGEQEAVQVVEAGRAARHRARHRRDASGTFSHAAMADMGDFAEQMALIAPFPPATADLPVYDALRSDLAASGEDALQPENLKASPMRSWIGLYALLYMIRDADAHRALGREAIKATGRGGQGRAHAGHVRRRGLDARHGPPGPVPAGRDEPLGHLRVGSRRRGRLRRQLRQGRRHVASDDVLCGSIFGAPAETC